jgi:hypothetical protein
MPSGAVVVQLALWDACSSFSPAAMAKSLESHATEEVPTQMMLEKSPVT